MSDNCGNGFRTRQHQCLCNGVPSTSCNTTTATIHIQNCFISCSDACPANKTTYLYLTYSQHNKADYGNESHTAYTGCLPKLSYIYLLKYQISGSSPNSVLTQFLRFGNLLQIKLISLMYPVAYVLVPPRLSQCVMDSFNKLDLPAYQTMSLEILYCTAPIFGEWSQWSLCNSECNMTGTANRTRNCVLEGRNVSVDYCYGMHLEYNVCLGPCYEWSEWSPIGHCNGECGNATLQYNRTCLLDNSTVALSKCVGNHSKVEPCYTGTPCYNFDEWTPWLTHDFGLTSYSNRSRDCLENNVTVTDSHFCNGSNNETLVLTWSEWSPCVGPCGFKKNNRTRSCLLNGDVIFNDTICGLLEEINSTCVIEICYVFNVTSWSEWTECNVCGFGNITRNRTCLRNETEYEWQGCSTDNQTETRSCFSTVECANITLWSEWSDCAGECDFGTRTRSRECMKNNATMEWIVCNTTKPQTETENCTMDISCPYILSLWSNWTECNGECPDILATRTRQCLKSDVEFDWSNCNTTELQTEEKSCFTEFCLNVSKWSEWSECIADCGAGVKSRNRSCIRNETEVEWELCSTFGNDTETESCDTGIECLGWSEWTYGKCNVSCGGGKREDRRKCLQENGICIGQSVKRTDCNEQPCPVHGNWCEWTEWTVCSASCNGGVQVRARTCTNPPPAFGGLNCSGITQESRSCHTGISCSGLYLATAGKDCSSHCDSFGKVCWPHVRKYIGENATTAFAAVGVSCSSSETSEVIWSKPYHPSLNTVTGGCEGVGNVSTDIVCNNTNVPPSARRLCYCKLQDDIMYDEWSLWSECSTTMCGHGFKKRHRRCIDTRFCSSEQIDKKACNEVPCPLDGGWSTWSPWKECSKECGNGERKKVRHCTSPRPLYDGRLCYGMSEYAEGCNYGLCPVHGGWGNWLPWNFCDKPCGGGNRTRYRVCDNPTPKLDGIYCQGSEKEHQKCNERPCRESKINIRLAFTKEKFHPLMSKESMPHDALKEKILYNIKSLYKDKGIRVKKIIVHSFSDGGQYFDDYLPNPP